MTMRKTFFLLAVVTCWFAAAAAPPPSSAVPRIAIIIDDVGPRYIEGKQAVTLPGPVTTAFLPQTANTRQLAEAAHASGKEIMLHLPLEATNGKALGPGGITLQMDEAQFLRTLRANIESVPHVRGVNNHMGSLLTRHPGAMTWLMRELDALGGFYFIDSRTHPDTVALKMAEEAGIPRAKRDVFLDNVQERDAIAAQFDRLVALAREHGKAVAIGHPYPETMAFLSDVLPRLEEDFGVQLVPASALLEGGSSPPGSAPVSSPTSPGPRRSLTGKEVAAKRDSPGPVAPAAGSAVQAAQRLSTRVSGEGKKEVQDEVSTRTPR